MRKSLLKYPLWRRSDQFHPRLWDINDLCAWCGWYGGIIDKRYSYGQRKSDYKTFKKYRHMHSSNYK